MGVDVGGTKILAAAVGADGRATAVTTRATPHDGPAPGLDAIQEAVDACAASAGGPAARVGVAFAGQVAGGRVRASPNLDGWQGLPLADRLQQRLGVPVTLANDGQAAAWAEWRFGHGRGTQDMVFLALGTGVGGGIVSGGRLVLGASGSAGEFGHVTVVAGGRRCTCGSRGCLEAYAGGWALAKEARRAVREDPRRGRLLLDLAGGRAARIDGHAVARAYKAGDPLACRVVADAGEMLSTACMGIANALAPALVVLGGGVTHGLPVFLQEARAGVAQALPGAERARVLRTKLGVAAAAVGAGDLARGA